jgi:iron complex transport system permease protein
MTAARRSPWLLAPLLLLALFLAGLRWGAVPLDWSTVFAWLSGQPVSPDARTILGELRWPRLWLAFVVGAGLSASGTCLQGLLRNPLVDPYILGVSAGGSLGAGIAMILHLPTIAGISPVPLMAFAGAGLVISVVYALGHSAQGLHLNRLLLSGVAISALASALLALLLVWHNEGMAAVVFWLMGSLADRGWTELAWILPYVLVGFGLLISQIHRLHVLRLGEDGAAHLGVPVERVKALTLFAATLITAACVAVSGLIGFVGLVIPHAARAWLKQDDPRFVLPLATLLGGALLIAADTVARTALAPQEIPVGIVTALLGVPFFLTLVRRSVD